MPGWSIGEVARRAGLAPSAIRYYERMGLLASPRRAHGQRRYDEHILDDLRFIQLARRAGFSLAEIQHLQHGFAPGTPPGLRWRQLSPSRIEQIDAQITHLLAMRALLTTTMACECARFEDCASHPALV